VSSVSLSAQPGFSDIPDSTWDGGSALSSAGLKALNADAKFATVRNEQFWGYYKHGETVATPVSPADGYVYSRVELLYMWSVYWTGSPPASPVNGTQVPPTRGATGAGGTFLQSGAVVDQATGAVACTTSYFDGTQHDTNDGIVLVMIFAQRSR
jgi:hypothetical protein